MSDDWLSDDDPLDYPEPVSGGGPRVFVRLGDVEVELEGDADDPLGHVVGHFQQVFETVIEEARDADGDPDSNYTYR